MINIKQENLIIQPTSNGWLIRDHSGTTDRYIPTLAVFNDFDEMVAWLKEFYLTKGDEKCKKSN